MASQWHEAFDDASQCTYYYHIETGETSWTLPPVDDQEESAVNTDAATDLSYMAFAAVRLQAQFRGSRDRRRVVRLLRMRYQTTIDPETHQTLYTDRRSGLSSWIPPALVTRLGVANLEDIDNDDDDDDMDFDTFQQEEDGREEDAEEADAVEDRGDGGDGITVNPTHKKRTFPRSIIQQRVDAAEDSETDAVDLDLSRLEACKLSSRIWNLATLTHLSLAHNHLIRIPSGIQDLVRLRHIDLSHNHLTRLPSCLQTTASLTYLDASHNRITTFSPKLWKLRSLQHLDLGWNLLQDVPYIEGDLKMLRDTREWQVGIGLLGDLRVLDLSHNQLTALPTSMEKCTALQILHLSHNRLAVLPDNVGDLHGLVELHLGGNELTELPEAIGNLTNLTMLNLDANQLTTLPEAIGNLQRLVDIDLRTNHILHFPDEFGALGQLQRVQIDLNPRLSTLANCLRFLPSVSVFSASQCGLVAFASTSLLCKAPVTRLTLRGNSLVDFPINLERSAMQKTLVELDLSRNTLGTFPLEIVTAPCIALETLDLSYNRLRVLPNELSRLRSLKTLVLSHNALGPCLVEAVAWLPQLLELRCDHNRLTTLPLAIGILKKLQRVDVACNQIEALPTSLLDLVGSLQSLHVNDNCLTTAPPVVALLSPSCFVDLSNNPFCAGQGSSSKETRVAPSPQHLYATAVQCFDKREYAQAEALLTQSLSLLEMDGGQGGGGGRWCQRHDYVPVHAYLRGLARYMVVKEARGIICQASQTVDECEQQLRGQYLAKQRAFYRALTKDHRKQAEEHPETEETSGSDPPEIKHPSINLPADYNQHDDTHEAPTRERLEAAQQQRTDARNHAALAATGAVDDLRRAIELGVAERPTAYVIQGYLFMETLDFPRAITSFTHALECVAPKDTSEKPLPLTSVSILLARAEAARLLGQLPAALTDVQRIVASLELDPPAYVVAKANALASEWCVQQSQYFVDHERLFRAFDVAPASGLARRPQVYDLHDLHDPHNLHAGKTQQQRPQTQKDRTPTHRFDEQVALLVHERNETEAATRQAMQTKYDQKTLALTKARAFKRELRENLVMEIEEHRQRRVDAERDCQAEQTRQELDREFNERLFLKYEDEYMRWLVCEERRIEAERQRRDDEARRKAEAKAQYEIRLARRGGRRQQLASRGTPTSTSTSTRKPSVGGASPPTKGSR